MQDAHVKLHRWLLYGKSNIQQEEDSFHQQLGLAFKEDTRKVQNLGHSFV
jgi:hypothetical protein